MSSAKWRLFRLGLNELTTEAVSSHESLSFTGKYTCISSLYHPSSVEKWKKMQIFFLIFWDNLGGTGVNVAAVDPD